jgi:hypothetical protein
VFDGPHSALHDHSSTVFVHGAGNLLQPGYGLGQPSLRLAGHVLRRGVNLGKGHSDQANATHRTLTVVRDVLIGGQMVLGHSGAMPGHHYAVADLDRT